MTRGEATGSARRQPTREQQHRDDDLTTTKETVKAEAVAVAMSVETPMLRTICTATTATTAESSSSKGARVLRVFCACSARVLRVFLASHNFRCE